MYRTLKKAGFSLLAIAALIFLFAPASFAWGGNGGHATSIIGESVKTEHGGTVGRVTDVVRGSNGSYVIIGLNGTDREVSVPSNCIRYQWDHVTYQGTKDNLYSMAPVYTRPGYNGTVRGYYGNGANKPHRAEYFDFNHHGSRIGLNPDRSIWNNRV